MSEAGGDELAELDATIAARLAAIHAERGTRFWPGPDDREIEGTFSSAEEFRAAPEWARENYIDATLNLIDCAMRPDHPDRLMALRRIMTQALWTECTDKGMVIKFETLARPEGLEPPTP